jgi:hypothetical protein
LLRLRRSFSSTTKISRARSGDGFCTTLLKDNFLRDDLGAQPSPWTKLGGGLAGSDGISQRSGAGVPAQGNAIDLSVQHAKPGAALYDVIGGSQINLPALGGLLVPYLDLTLISVADENGNDVQHWNWPVGYP